GPEARVVYVGRRASDGTDLGWWEVPLEAGAGTERQVLASGAPPVGSVDATSEVGANGDAWTRREAVSDDRRRLLVVQPDGRPVLVDLATTNPQPPEPIALDAGHAEPHWDRSAARFLLVAREAGTDGATSIWRIGLDGSTTRIAPGSDSAAAAPDGGIATIGTAAAGSSGGEDGHLVYVAPRASAGRALTTAADLVDRDPSFGPDGGSILFLRVGASNPSSSAGIWVVGPDGRELRQLSTDGAEPRWLP
ncbi:MAG TPA: hypothetical protein VFR93_04125, partial [Candidatus Limnocylindrales bacterium]|nr:hypothetical protein [Candidatus Limnocylindrales bacterium]